MTRFRDFDAARAEADPLTFKLGGEIFETSGVIPAGPILDIAAAMTSGDDLDSFAAFHSFFTSIVSDDDAERFALAVRKVNMTTIIELLGWIVEEATGRPLPSASSSESPPSLTGLPSRAGPSSPAETRSA